MLEKSVLILAVFTLLWGCALNETAPRTTDRSSIGNETSGVTGPIPWEDKEVPFETIAKGYLSEHYDRAQGVIDSEEELVEVWGKLPIEGVPTIDFTTEMVLAALQGGFVSGGYDVEIVKLVETKDSIEAVVNERQPSKGCVVTGALTQPYHIVKTRKSDKEVRFIITLNITVCD